jgi:hypothetical protein
MSLISLMSLLLKSLEPYTFPKGTSREEVCSRLIKPTTQANRDNVGLLTSMTVVSATLTELAYIHPHSYPFTNFIPKLHGYHTHTLNLAAKFR